MTRARITLGLALLVPVLVMLAREIYWLVVPLTLFGMFLIVWGRAPSETERLVSQLPGGKHLLKGLNQLDMILTPRDRDVEQHLREVIGRYDTRRRQALKTLLITQNAGLVGSDWIVFNQDALVLHPHSGPGPIKDEFRESIKRILKELEV
jgi:hypothetical protein